MILNQIKKEEVKATANALSKSLVKYPLFMFFCKDINKRPAFIEDYFRYYLPEWSKYDTLICDDKKSVVVSLVDPKTFEYRFKGQGALRMKSHKDASTVFVHRENVEMVLDIIVPESLESRVMNIYAKPKEENIQQIAGVIREAKELAVKDGFVLVYETFSRSLIPFMQNQGFELVYSKPFMNTQYIQTFMLYNLK